MDEFFERPKTYIQWMLDNRCNYNCSYCHEMFRKGDRAKLTNETFLEICKDLTYHYDDLGRDVVFEFLGGEPTLQEKIPEIGKRLSNFPTSIILKTNGSAPLEWWKESRSVIAGVVISVHREFADLDHIQNVIEFLQNSNYGYPIQPEVLFPVTNRDESFNWGVEQVKRFRQKYDLGNLQLLYSDFGRGSSMYLPYTEKQWAKWYEFNPPATESDKPKGLHRYQPIFTGQQCYAGVDTLTIDSDGNAWRGWCRQGGIIGNIHELPVYWPTDPIICQKDFCHNGFDRGARKEKI
jgi:organic radical activating enzyme